MEAWWRSIPPITRTWVTAVALIAVAARVGALSPGVLAYDPALVVRKFHVWRLVSPFFWFGRPSMGWLFQMMMLHNFGARLEADTFASGGGPGRGSTADFFWQLVLGAFALLNLATAMGIPFLGPPLLAFVIYLWSRRHPEEEATFWFFRVPGAMLPWVMVGFSFLMGDDPVPDLLGIAAAHAYFYAVDVLPRAGGALAGVRLWLQTPAAVVRAFGDAPTGLAAPRPGTARGPNPPAGHVWGGGQRLG